MTNELVQIVGGLTTIAIIIGALALMVGGPNLASRYVKWLIKGTLNILEWIVTIPIRFLRSATSGPTPKKKKRRKNEVGNPTSKASTPVAAFLFKRKGLQCLLQAPKFNLHNNCS